MVVGAAMVQLAGVEAAYVEEAEAEAMHGMFRSLVILKRPFFI